MNAPQTLYRISHPLRISRYGAHISLSTAARIDVIDALTQTLRTTVSIQAQLECIEKKLHNVSFRPVQQMFCRLARANANYTRFLVTGIADLGGYTQAEGLYSLSGATETQCFADCLADICRGMRQLQVADAMLREFRECAIANKDPASKRLFEECTRRNAQFLSLIKNNLSHE
ncbi:hypothetical protein PS925_01999 [Pseudomonas fluorescens]|uniref:DUF2383 domain-containing protein n=1 Tax=Pseudomonas fluorescens TaxID=294 RepID=A0A5E7TEZ0_PSEFL|nr:hypothetical protein [Pseudomonas fluorescens]VVP97701.1 hypothetical protein PS925_01999 [Pseudomonas fluorescens]